MRLLCRECSATYEAPDNLFGAQPREVRCNRCGFQWTVVGAVKAVPGAGLQPVMAPPEAATAGGMPPEFMRGPAMPPAAAPVPPPVSDPVAAPAPPVAPAIASPSMPAKTSALADNLAGRLPSGMPAPVAAGPLVAEPVVAEPVVAPPAPSTRSLLARGETEPEIAMGDPEERRLSHELSFGETERSPVAHRGSRGLWRGLWLIVMLIVVLAIAAVLFEPQILSAVPALGRLYAAVGL